MLTENQYGMYTMSISFTHNSAMTCTVYIIINRVCCILLPRRHYSDPDEYDRFRLLKNKMLLPWEDTNIAHAI